MENRLITEKEQEMTGNPALIYNFRRYELMENRLITEIEQQMMGILNNAQLMQLQKVLEHCFYNYEVVEKEQNSLDEGRKNSELLNSFLAAKHIEGCSDKSMKYYRSVLDAMLKVIEKPIKHIVTDDLRQYLDQYQKQNNASKVTVDNVRRILSSFFAWLEDEDYILKSPVRRIHKVKSGKTVKEIYSDEALVIMSDHCETKRDLAMIDLLSSTGMRVGELVNLNRGDIDFDNRECVVFGKGEKERKVYFDARTKIHLLNYLNSRTDDNEALFVSLLSPHNRLLISGVEIRLRELGIRLDINRVHPHKFRRTLATRAIDKGMPIEQVQQLLGHEKIETTLHYAQVDQNNVKNSHRRYIG